MPDEVTVIDTRHLAKVTPQTIAQDIAERFAGCMSLVMVVVCDGCAEKVTIFPGLNDAIEATSASQLSTFIQGLGWRYVHPLDHASAPWGWVCPACAQKEGKK